MKIDWHIIGCLSILYCLLQTIWESYPDKTSTLIASVLMSLVTLVLLIINIRRNYHQYILVS